MKQYIFTVRRNAWESGTEIDSFYEVPLDASMYDADILSAQEELLGNPLQPELKDLSQALFAMRLRMRFNPDFYQHLCVVKVDDGLDLDREGLQCLIDTKEKQGILESFLKEAAIT
jgi:hypothetical protein